MGTDEKTNKNEGMSVRQIEFSQQVRFIDVSFVDAVVKEKASKGVITDYAYIVHDKDVKDDGTLVEPHIHLMMRFKDSRQLKHIAKWFKSDTTRLERIKGKWVTAIRYLTHANNPEKYQYEDSEVVSNFDYTKEKENFSTRKSGSARKDEIVGNFASGQWKYYDVYDSEKISSLEAVKYDAEINKALKYRQNYLRNNEEGRTMEVIYMYGGSGNGKTTLAKEYAEKQGYKAYLSSAGANPLDDYQGQECIILDDFRPEDMKFSELLKLLDNHTSSMAKARYYNKYMGECKLIIISTIDDIDVFFKKMNDTKKEPIKQLERRCQMKFHVEEKTVDVFNYDDQAEKYEFAGTMKNPVFGKKFKKRERASVKKIADMFGSEVVVDDNVIEFDERRAM